MLISVHNLVKRFGNKTVLRGLNFEVEAGDFVAVLGPNGAGKSTFLRILASLSRPTLGEIKVAGFSIPAEAEQVRSRLGMVSHLPLLYGDLTAEENLRFFGKLYGVPDLKHRIDEIIRQTGLDFQRKEPVRTLSRGMTQRLAIGRAVLHNPDILLLDEPYTGLDQEACDMLDQLLRQVSSQGRTVVMTSHDFSRVTALAARFDVLSRGIIQASINSDQLPQDGLADFYQKMVQQGRKPISNGDFHDQD